MRHWQGIGRPGRARLAESFECVNGRKSFLSLVELFLWEMKIDEVSSEKEQILVADRERCRIKSGAAVVIPNRYRFHHHQGLRT
eukprot:scaffold5629_cov58-Cylindrotheca_fusiformis.AAC.2